MIYTNFNFKTLLFVLITLINSLLCLSQTPKLLIQQGHTDRVTCVKYSNNEEYVLTGSMDQMIKLWEVKTGFLKANFKGHNGMIYELIFSKDDRFFYSLSFDDQTLMKWSVTNDSIPLIAIKTKDQASEMMLSNDGKKLFVLNDNGITVYDALTLKIIKEIQILSAKRMVYDTKLDRVIVISDDYENGAISCFSAFDYSLQKKINFEEMTFEVTFGNNSLFFSGIDKKLFQFDLSNNVLKTIPFIIEDRIESLEFDSKRNQLYIGTSLGSLFTYDFNKNEQKEFSKKIHNAMIYDIELSKKSNCLITASYDWTSKIWDIPSQTEIQEFALKVDPIMKVDVADNFQNIAFITGNLKKSRKIGIWNLFQAKTEFIIDETENYYTDLSVAKGNKVVSTINYDGAINWFNFPNSSTSFSHLVYGEKAKAMTMLPNTKTVYYGTDLGNIVIWRPDKDLAESHEITKSSINALQFSPDGNFLFVGTDKGHLLVLNGKTFEVLNEFNTHGLGSNYKDSQWKISNGASLTVDIMGDGNLTANSTSITAISYHQSTNTIAVAGGNRIAIIDFNELKIVGNIEEFSSGFASLDISPDGKQIAGAGADGLIHLYDLTSKTSLKTFKYHQNEVRTVKFAKNSNYLISASLDGQLILCDLNKPNSFLSFLSINLGDDQIVFNQDGYYFGSKGAASVITFNENGKILPFRQYDLQANRPDIILSQLSEFTSQELNLPISSNLIKSYHQAFIKRLTRQGITTTQSKITSILPTIEIISSSKINEDLYQVSLNMNANSNQQLKSLVVLVNGIPIYGVKGLTLSGLKSTQNIQISLSNGKNLMEAYCLNINGTSSLIASQLFFSKSKNVPKTYFLGIGVNQYLDSNFNLKYATKDINDFKDALIVKDSNLVFKLLLNQEVTVDNVLKMKDFLKQANVNDKVIVLISGHGLLSEDLNYYYATHDVDFTNPKMKGLLIQDLESLFDGIAARQKLLLIDACNSGEQDVELLRTKSQAVSETSFGAKGGGIRLGTQNSFDLMKNIFTDLQSASGATIIASSSGSYFSFESDKYQNGMFTFSAIEALNGGADLNNDQLISLLEFKNYIIKRVTELTKGKQRPTMRREIAGFDWNF